MLRIQLIVPCPLGGKNSNWKSMRFFEPRTRTREGKINHISESFLSCSGKSYVWKRFNRTNFAETRNKWISNYDSACWGRIPQRPAFSDHRTNCNRFPSKTISNAVHPTPKCIRFSTVCNVVSVISFLVLERFIAYKFAYEKSLKCFAHNANNAVYTTLEYLISWLDLHSLQLNISVALSHFCSESAHRTKWSFDLHVKLIWTLAAATLRQNIRRQWIRFLLLPSALLFFYVNAPIHFIRYELYQSI